MKSSAEAVQAPTKARWIVLLIVMAIMAVTTLNRLNMSVAGKAIEVQFHFSTIQMGRIFSSFLWGYGLFQVPWGYICDRIGPRRTLTISMLCFAVGAGAMVMAPRIASVTGISALAAFRLVRFLTGVGEAAVSSNVTRVIASWTSVRDRGFASGLQVCGLGLGGTLTPVFIAWTMLHLGWQVSFLSCAGLAFAVVAVWNWYATDWPEHHWGVNPAELERIHPGARAGELPLALKPPRGRVPWLKMLSSRSVWGLIIGYGFQGYAFYVYYNWFYFYAVKSRGLPLMQAAAWTSAPFLGMALLSPVGGWISDRASRRIGRRYGRIATVWMGMGIAGVLLFSGSHVKITALALPMIALAAGFTMFAAASFWAACIDLAPGFSASLSALMNTFGSIGGAVSSTVTASIVVHQGWNQALETAAWITVVSAVWFSAVNTERAIDERPTT